MSGHPLPPAHSDRPADGGTERPHGERGGDDRRDQRPPPTRYALQALARGSKDDERGPEQYRRSERADGEPRRG